MAVPFLSALFVTERFGTLWLYVILAGGIILFIIRILRGDD